MNKLRKDMIDLVCKIWDILDPTKANSGKFINYTNTMTDDEFFSMIKNLISDPKRHLYFEIEAFDNEPKFEVIEEAANELDVKLFDYLAMPHLSGERFMDDGYPVPDYARTEEDWAKIREMNIENETIYYTVHKVFTGFINMRRVQQMVNKKNHIPIDIDKRNPKTGMVTGESKAARVSDMEQMAIICHGTKAILKEMFGPRSGDQVMKDEMLHQIATTGSASLESLPNSKLNKVALNTANVILLGAGLESNLVTEGGILPRTLKNQYNEARGLKRRE